MHVALVLSLLVAGSPATPAGYSAPRLVAAASAQVGQTTIYDGSYRRLAYPGGDVPIERGVCADVIVRAYRALGVDLQVELHEDMKRAFAAYPRAWGLARPDPNIDHRRVLNLATFLRRKGAALEVRADPRAFRSGDLVTWRLPNGLPHIGIVSDRVEAGRPWIVHNIGAGTRLEDTLFEFEITGHYRWLPPPRVSTTATP